MVDLAIGVIIRAALGRIVDSLVGDIFMPLIGAVAGGLDCSNDFIRPSSAVTAESLAEPRKPGAVIAWGNFATIAIKFLIIARALFLVVKGINRVRLQVAQQPSAPPLSRQEKLLEEIRDLLPESGKQRFRARPPGPGNAREIPRLPPYPGRSRSRRR